MLRSARLGRCHPGPAASEEDIDHALSDEGTLNGPAQIALYDDRTVKMLPVKPYLRLGLSEMALSTQRITGGCGLRRSPASRRWRLGKSQPASLVAPYWQG